MVERLDRKTCLAFSSAVNFRSERGPDERGIMKSNVAKKYSAETHEGGKADSHIKPFEQLRRMVSSCLLFENTFYEDGVTIADEIANLCQKVDNERIGMLAIQARNDLKLRHVPLFLCVQLARKRWNGLAPVLAAVIHRPDELGEFLSLYWKPNKQPISNQVKKGLAAAFLKFTEYQLGKWDKGGAIKLKDVMILTHPKPQNPEQSALFERVMKGTLAVPDTWEVALSAGSNKRQTWERLLRDGKLGYMALLMNLRSMVEVGVDRPLIIKRLMDGAENSKALPFRFITAMKHAPSLAQVLSAAMEAAISGEMPGTTAIVVDTSGSMSNMIASKSEVTRWEAAAGLAVLLRKKCPDSRVFTFNDQLDEIAAWKGMALIQTIKNVQGNTNLYRSLLQLREICPSLHRIVVLTDEQSNSGVLNCWAKFGYILNVAPNNPALMTNGGWVRFNGWSERIVDWMQVHEAENDELHEN